METSRGNDLAAKGSGVSPALIAAALLLPPLAVFLAQGASRDFWIAFALTCLGYFPGVGFALFRIFSRPAGDAAEA